MGLSENPSSQVQSSSHFGEKPGGPKPRMDLLLSARTLHLVDFGLATFLDEESVQCYSKGTAEYASPEVLQGEAPCEKQDVCLRENFQKDGVLKSLELHFDPSKTIQSI